MSVETLHELRELLDFACDIAWRAGRITLEYYQTGIVPELKADASPVTIADRRAEEFLRREIASRFPDHAILGEEYGESNQGASQRWILDPIDGTKSFVHGVPFYGVLIGLEREGQAVLGVVNIPALNELVAAAEGLGCYFNGRRARVSPCSQLNEALLLTTDVTSFKGEQQATLDQLLQATRLHRTWGDCYAYMMVATGRAEIAMDAKMNVWDCAPLLPIIQEAGGRFSDWTGNATIHGGNAIATNGALHEQVLEIVQKP